MRRLLATMVLVAATAGAPQVNAQAAPMVVGAGLTCGMVAADTVELRYTVSVWGGPFTMAGAQQFMLTCTVQLGGVGRHNGSNPCDTVAVDSNWVPVVAAAARHLTTADGERWCEPMYLCTELSFLTIFGWTETRYYDGERRQFVPDPYAPCVWATGEHPSYAVTPDPAAFAEILLR